MKRYSKIGVMFRHPLRTLFTWIWVMLLYAFVQDFMQFFPFGTGVTGAKIIFAVTFFIALCITQRHYNKLEMISPQQRKKKRGLFGFLFSSVIAADRAFDRKQQEMGDAFAGAILDSFKTDRGAEERVREARRQADADARARYDARNNAQKARWDARDAALRGKDKAAWQYKNQADYWDKQSRRYR